jgi:histidinol-phosphate aminotransferase
VAALAALNDEAELQRRVALLRAENARLQKALGELGFQTIPGEANFILTRPPESIGAGARRALEAAGEREAAADERNAAELYYRYLKQNNVLIRYFASPPCTDHVRISIGSTAQMDRLLELTRSLI